MSALKNEEEKRERERVEGGENKATDLFFIFLFSVSVWQFIPLVFYPDLRDCWRCRRTERAAAAAMDGGLCPCQVCVVLPARKLAGEDRPPSGGLGYGNDFRYRRQDGFHSLQLHRERGGGGESEREREKNVFSLHFWQKWSFGLFARCTQSRVFLVKNAIGGKL